MELKCSKCGEGFPGVEGENLCPVCNAEEKDQYKGLEDGD
jgi:rubrerythrin